jgi:hypothetical protein
MQNHESTQYDDGDESERKFSFIADAVGGTTSGYNDIAGGNNRFVPVVVDNALALENQIILRFTLVLMFSDTGTGRHGHFGKYAAIGHLIGQTVMVEGHRSGPSPHIGFIFGFSFFGSPDHQKLLVGAILAYFNGKIIPDLTVFSS